MDTEIRKNIKRTPLCFRLSNGRKPRPVRCLVILGLCLFVTAGLQAQTPDPTPLDVPQPGYGLRLALFRGFKTGVLARPIQRVDPYDRLKTPVLKPRKRAKRRPYPRLWYIQGRRVWRLRLEPGRDKEAQP